MKTTDIPKAANVLWYFTKQLKIDDDKVAALQVNNGNPQSTHGRFVGMCYLSGANIQRLNYPILVDDVMFAGQNPLDCDKTVLGSAVKLVNDQVEIYINSLAYQMFLNDTTRDYIYGLIAHEVGHILAGHLDLPEMPDESLFEDWRDVALHLLEGKSIFSIYEHEANQYAISLVGVAPVIAILMMQASLSANIAMRMEFSNQVHQIIQQTHAQFIPLKIKYTNLEINIFTEQELETLRNSPDPYGSV